MPISFLDLFFTLTASGAGVAIGWLIGYFRKGNVTKTGSYTPSSEEGPESLESTFPSSRRGMEAEEKYQKQQIELAEKRAQLDKQLSEFRKNETDLKQQWKTLAEAQSRLDAVQSDYQDQLKELDEERETYAKSQETLEQLQGLVVTLTQSTGGHTEKMRGFNSELTQVKNDPEAVISIVSELIIANEEMGLQLESAEKRIEHQAKELADHVEEARTDSLTKIANRRAFDLELARGQDEYQYRGRPMSVLMVDVDYFKKFNDTYGHLAGDQVLIEVAQALTNAVKREHLVARYGGEEFAIIFRGTTLAEAREQAEAARAAISEVRVPWKEETLRVDASGGLAQLLLTETTKTLVSRADKALYQSKEAGRNRGYMHDGKAFFPLLEELPTITEADDLEAEIVTQETAQPSQMTEEETLTELKEQAQEILHETKTEKHRAEDRTADENEPVTSPDSIDDIDFCTENVFKADLVRRIAEQKRTRVPVSILIFRIDKMKESFEKHGEQYTAKVHRAVKQFLKTTKRDMDHLSQFNNNDFGLMVPTATLQEAKMIAERLRKAIANCKLPHKGEKLSFTVSVGVAEAGLESTFDSIWKSAHSALEVAVEKGGNCSYFDTESGPKPYQSSKGPEVAT
ncbi:MAG: diguanylate cyclase [Pirellulaceae bacterium]|nr:diguanylate cyclase [Pirellulaceae bacterium]